MSWFSIPKSFAAKTLAKAAEVDENFEAVEEALNGLFGVDRVSASGDLTCTNSYQDVNGASLAITPPLASKLLCLATFDFEIAAGNKFAGLWGKAFGALNVDGSDQAAKAVFQHRYLNTTETGNTPVARATVAQGYAVDLIAGAHTVTLRAKYETGEKGENHTVKAIAQGTQFLYLLIPDPEP